ncbi:MAG: response regulator transcription factor [Candidatus Limnocylindrales bacterium]
MSDHRSVGFRWSLTKREYEILMALATGETRDNVARTFGVSRAMINRHLERAFKKLGAASLVEAYFKMGWLQVLTPSTEPDTIPVSGDE